MHTPTKPPHDKHHFDGHRSQAYGGSRSGPHRAPVKSLARLAAEEAFSALCAPPPPPDREAIDREPWSPVRHHSPGSLATQPVPNDSRTPRVFRLAPARTEAEPDANEAAPLPRSRKSASDKAPGPVRVVYVAEVASARIDVAASQAATAAPRPPTRRAPPRAVSPESASAELEARIHANLESAWQRCQDDSFREVSKRLNELDAVLADVAFARSFRDGLLPG